MRLVMLLVAMLLDKLMPKVKKGAKMTQQTTLIHDEDKEQ